MGIDKVSKEKKYFKIFINYQYLLITVGRKLRLKVKIDVEKDNVVKGDCLLFSF